MDEAWLHFGKPKLKRQFNAPAPTLQLPEFNREKWGTAILAALAAPDHHKSAMEGHARLRAAACAAMRADLCASLNEASLLAYGQQVSPTIVRTYRRIQPDFWKLPTPQWESDIASDAAQTFQRIVIIDPAQFPELQARPRVGGHTERDRIYQALKEIAGKDDFPIKPSHIQRQRLRKELARQFPDLNVEGAYFHNDTLQRHINQYLKYSLNNESDKPQ